MVTISEKDYNAKHKDFRGVWSSDEIHGTNYNGKRTMLANENGSTVLLIEGVNFEIIKEDLSIKKTL